MLHCESEDLFYLPIPVLPIMTAGQLPILVRNLALKQQSSEIAAALEQEILGAAVEIETGQRRDSFGWSSRTSLKRSFEPRV